MARDNNFLLGFGESIAQELTIARGGGMKSPPYDYDTARSRMSERLVRSVDEFQALPRAACPGDLVVAKVTIHPRYVAKSDFPSELFEALEMRAVGSRPRMVKPELWGISRHPTEALSEEIFIVAKRSRLADWASQLPSWDQRSKPAQQIQEIEDLAPYRAVEKVKGLPESERVVLEVVLHNAGKANAVAEAFARYAQMLGADVRIERRRDIRGLTFVPVVTRHDLVAPIAEFSMVRVARGMPSIRPLPSFLRGTRPMVTVPDLDALAPDLRVAIFDGGLPSGHGLDRWVTHIEPDGIGGAEPGYVQHGLAVTGALLFGKIDGTDLIQPLCTVDHHRVLDGSGDMAPLDVLERITAGLDASAYEFANLSVGPDQPMADDDVTQWTAELDQRCAGGKRIIAVAVGNRGEADAAMQLNRVQPPSDGVNILAVGACDGTGERAPYSCVGPGRSPGIVKPDGVAFGGTKADPFVALSIGGDTIDVRGTSFAAPLALRSAVAVKAQLGDYLRPLAIRALLLHRASGPIERRPDVGWGQFDLEPARLITCDDDEALVVFQGTLPEGKHLRAPVPVPDDPLAGDVTITATLVIAPEIDPEFPGAYTRGGLEVSFRPHLDKFPEYDDGSTGSQPKTRPFFSEKNLYGAPEFELRADGQKWEPCRKAVVRLRASSLFKPCFDIKYVHRIGAVPGEPTDLIPYALIISVKAPSVPNLYNRVVRTYLNRLVQLRPRLRLPIRV